MRAAALTEARKTRKQLDEKSAKVKELRAKVAELRASNEELLEVRALRARPPT